METIVQKTLSKVFNDLTQSAKKFENWYCYNTAEIKFQNMLENIGIGINSDCTAIKIFFIDKNYGNTDLKRFKQTFRIGIPPRKPLHTRWSLELTQDSLASEMYNFRFISYHMQVAHLIMQLIEETERTFKFEKQTN